MSLRMPSEIVVDDVLPTLRVMLRKLGKRGLTQGEIADDLGVTQAAVSAYVTWEANVEKRIRDHAWTERTVDR